LTSRYLIRPVSDRTPYSERVPVGRALARTLAGLAGAQLGLRLASGTSRWVGPLRVRADLALGRTGGVRIAVPPLGSARICSHRGPLQATVRAEAVDPTRAAALLEHADDPAAARAVRQRLEAVLHAARGDTRRLATNLGTRSAAAALGGAALTAAATLHRPRDVAGALLAAAAALAGSAAAAAATVDRQAWRTPELTGLLADAPVLLGDLEQAPERVATYRDQLADLLRTGTAVYRRVADLPELPDTIRLLHVSDIHLSPFALPLAAALAADYDLAAVVDTGDLVDWGTPAEDAFADQIGRLGVPYVFVKGNHDSTGIAAAVARQPNATVLTADGGVREIAGLRFAGMADPRFTPDKTTGDDTASEKVVAAAAAFANRYVGEQLDVVLVHDPAAARELAALHVPLVLAGHTHRRAARRLGETLLLVQGSTGGSGLRGVQQNPPTPLALSVLHVERATRQLAAVDEITLGGLGEVSLQVARRPVADLVRS
jgi:predicted MPP superfamily phosphohydrolase